MTHTWSDVAYGFLVGTDGTPSPFVAIILIVGLIYFGVKTL